MAVGDGYRGDSLGCHSSQRLLGPGGRGDGVSVPLLQELALTKAYVSKWVRAAPVHPESWEASLSCPLNERRSRVCGFPSAGQKPVPPVKKPAVVTYLRGGNRTMTRLGLHEGVSGCTVASVHAERGSWGQLRTARPPHVPCDTSPLYAPLPRGVSGTIGPASIF